MSDPLSEEVVAWLERLHLAAYADKARTWCNETGAVSVAEILENLDDFATKLQLRKLERKRVEKEQKPTAQQGGSQSSPQKPNGNQTAPAAVTPKSPRAEAKAQPSQPSQPSQSSHPPAITGFFGPPGNLNKYRLGKELGQGATATVYECWHGSDVYAAKTMSLSKLRLQPGFQRMADTLKREVSILFQLRHKRIVSLYDVVEEVSNKGHPEKLYLVMELVPGGELFDRIVEMGSFPEQPTAKYVFLQIAEGLMYIHSKDIVYRDLKPENILVDERSSRPNLLEIKLSDFGHSKLINDGYSTPFTRVGTPQYWAPEVSDPRMAAKGYTMKVDLWSLGVVLYVMLIGAYPFDGMASSIEDQIRRARIEFRQSASGHTIGDLAQDLIRSLVVVDPEQRLSLDKCLEHPWVVIEGCNFSKMIKTETEINPRVVEERLQLPGQPTRQQVDSLRRDLIHWMAKFHGSARVKEGQILATLGDISVVGHDHIRMAKEELCQVVEYNFGSRPTSQASAGYPAALPVVREEPVRQSPSFRMLAYTLCVHPEHGAGLDLQPERGGMRVENVCEVPGQPGLLRGDLIIKVNEVSLRGNAERVEALFGREFGDGVLVSVKRFS